MKRALKFWGGLLLYSIGTDSAWTHYHGWLPWVLGLAITMLGGMLVVTERRPA